MEKQPVSPLAHSLRQAIAEHHSNKLHEVLLKQAGNPELKWLHRSALQKSIRRNQPADALRYATHLLKLDSPSLWRTLSICAVEDVGEPVLVGWTLAMTLKSFRDRMTVECGSETLILDFLISRLCASPKTRAACELSLSVDLAPPTSPTWIAVSRKTIAELTEALKGRSCFASYAALTHLRGKTPVGVPRSVPPAARGEVLQLIANLSERRFADRSATIREAMQMCVERPMDTMHLAMWVITALFEGRTFEFVEDVIPSSRQIRGLSAEAIDVHTREGQTAIRWFYQALTSIPAYAPTVRQIAPHRAVKALGAVLFVEEGGLVDVRHRSPSLDALRELQDITYCEASGVPVGLLPYLREIVRTELPRLHGCRERAMRSHFGSVE